MKTLTTQIESHSLIRHSFCSRMLLITTFALVFLMIGWPQAASVAIENNARQRDAKDDVHGRPKATATPTPIDCSNPNPPIKVIENPGQYELVGPCAVGVSLAIQANDVDLNLNGFTISGLFRASSCNDPGTGTGISVLGHSYVHIYNGTVAGFTRGIQIAPDSNQVTPHDNQVNNVFVTRNCTGIGLSFANNNHINDNRVSGNFQSGVQLSLSNDNTLVSNQVKNNANGGPCCGKSGVFLSMSDRNIIAFNDISGTKKNSTGEENYGLRLLESSRNNIIVGNTVNDNSGAGIVLDGPSPEHAASIGNVVQANTALRNAPDNSNRYDLWDANANEPPLPPSVCNNINLFNIWRFNLFVTDNEGDGPGVGCIQ